MWPRPSVERRSLKLSLAVGGCIALLEIASRLRHNRGDDVDSDRWGKVHRQLVCAPCLGERVDRRGFHPRRGWEAFLCGGTPRALHAARIGCGEELVLSHRIAHGAVGFALVGGALFAPIGIAFLLVVLGAVVFAVRSQPVSHWVLRGVALLAGFGLGLGGLWGLPQILVLGALMTKPGRRFSSMIAIGVAAGPLVLVAAALMKTGWSDEAWWALHLASGVSLGVLLVLWSDETVAWGRSQLGFGLVGLALVAVLPLPAATWPVYRDLDGSGENPAALLKLLRRGAAGEPRSGYAAAGLWLERYEADVATLRSICPLHGFSPGGGGSYEALGRAGCGALRDLPEEGAATLRESESPSLRRLAAELRAQAGHIDADTPAWLLSILNRNERRPQSWSAFNRRADFTVPTPARVRGIRAQGAGRLIVAHAFDLEDFALTSVTKHGGHGLSATLETPTQQTLEVLNLEGVARRGLHLTVYGSDGKRLRWGCGLESGADSEPLPQTICEGVPDEARLDVGQRLPGGVDRIVITGEYAIRRLWVDSPL